MTLLALPAAGCDECELGEVRCDGNDLLECDSDKIVRCSSGYRVDEDLCPLPSVCTAPAVDGGSLTCGPPAIPAP